jgi:hypothetical protein
VYDQETSIESNHVLSLEVKAHTSGGSWGGEDIWSSPCVIAQNVDEIATLLGIPESKGNLLVKFVLSNLQPSLESNGETPIKHEINALKAKGKISSKPKQHLWYDLWEYTLNKKGGNWSN